MSSRAGQWRDAWKRNWPGSQPEADEMKWLFPDRWVRFHALPHGKRYPETDDEYATVLTRHHIVLGELLECDANVLVVTVADGPQTRERRCGDIVRATTRAHRWWSFETRHSEPDWPEWRTAFVSRMRATPEALDPLLRLVIDDVEHGVILAPADFGWLYHPYDGGADVLLPTMQARDDLRARHQEWLSDLPSGL